MLRREFVAAITSMLAGFAAGPFRAFAASSSRVICRPRRVASPTVQRLPAGATTKALITNSGSSTARVVVGDRYVKQGGGHVYGEVRPGDRRWFMVTDFSQLYVYARSGSQVFYTGGVI